MKLILSNNIVKTENGKAIQFKDEKEAKDFIKQVQFALKIGASSVRTGNKTFDDNYKFLIR